MPTKEQTATVIESQLFDERYYQAQLTDRQPQSLSSLIDDYFARGAREGKDPHPLFCTLYYLAENPDVEAAGMNPLLHYIFHGAKEGRRPNKFFDSKYYSESIPEESKDINPLSHYLSLPNQRKTPTDRYFDSFYYLVCYPELLLTGSDPLEHYLQFGHDQKRRSVIHFDPQFYLAMNPDVLGAGLDPQMHFLRFGREEGRLPCKPCAESLNHVLVRLSSGNVLSHEWLDPRLLLPSQVVVYWGSPLLTHAQNLLFEAVVSALPEVEFQIHEGLTPIDANAPDISNISNIWSSVNSASNVSVCTWTADNRLFLKESSIFVNGLIDSPISELLIAAIRAGLLIIGPEESELSSLLAPDEASLIPGEVLSASMIIHAIRYAIANRDDSHTRASRAAQKLRQRAAAIDTTR